MKNQKTSEREEGPGYTKKGYNRMVVFFNNEFIEEMDMFLRNILIDHRLDSAKNTRERFSVAVRTLITNYNTKFKNEILLKKEGVQNG